ncbi:PREDICTED: inositol 1,4,5-trisphosphate receptor type 3-like isoform X1 [Amphimedon queenslandica]|uniref:Ion transport domain-containing protein n=1 Tax=Amphimedon queenslandica TaxID=400682 RepID=A0AAN0J1Y4_AMPQE|nr:PREDICTED: inositol 1,4,5-trisphosphate receptor type 3-like isoform X1 [Amphimedon queenslandica]|eukprot:XP_019850747.1 PREDICTED: inositol 1,4,5-trisphosphate receptor type 3-like isoform X1 [Amphimedon queenslandica]
MQEYISKLIYDYSTDVLGHLLDKENPLYINKIELLKKNDNDNDPNLYLLLNITDLIASCTTGHCHYAESVCCQFYTLDDLLNILFNQKIAIHRKLPFIRLLNSTYLATERDSGEACATALAENRQFWKFNKEIVSETYKLWKNSDKITAEQNLRKRNNFYWSITLLMHTDNLATKIDKNFLYIFEGLIPLLIAFYSSGRSKSCSDRFTEAEELVQELKKFADFNLPFVTEKIIALENSRSIICPEPIHDHQTDVNDSQTSSHSDSFQTFVEKCYNTYTNKSVTRNSPMQSSGFGGCDLDLEDMQRRLLIPSDPVFQKLIDKFKDSENHLKKATKKSSAHEIQTKDLKVKSLKATKLLLLLQTLIQKQKPLGLRKIDLENMTLTTLKLICGIVYSGIKEVKSSKHQEKQPKDFVAPLQKILLDQGIVPMLFDLLHHPNVDITFQVIACLNVLLYFGNEEAQQIIISFTQKDRSLIMIVHQILRKFYTKASIVQKAKSSKNQPIIDSRVAIVLDVIASLCDGQQKDIQDAMRDEQIFDESSIINQVSFVLLYIINSVNFEKNEDAIVVAQSATHALIEMCAGNYKNQIVVFKAQVVISINGILGKDSSAVNEVNWKLYELQCSSMELLEILLEEIDENSLSLASCIAKHFEISTLLQRMFNFWESALIRSRLSNEQFNKDLCRGYSILRRIADFKEISVDTLVRKKYFKEVFKDNNTTEAEKMWKSCTNWSSRVEIIYQMQNQKKLLTRAYFPCDPHADFSAKEKEILLLHIKRRTPQEKLIDLLKWTKELKLSNDQKKKTNEKGKLKLFYWILQTSTIRNICLFLLTILLNIFVFFLKSPSNDDVHINGVCKNIEANNETCDNTSSIYFQPIFDPEAPEWYYPVHYILSALHLVLAIFMVICYFYKNKHRIHFRIFWFKKIMYKYKKGVKRRKLLYNFLNKVSCGKIYFGRPEPAEYYQIFALSFQPMYRILFLIFSILGIWKGYFLCGCMIYPFLGNSVILHIIQALKKSAFQLLIIFALGIVFIYIYAVASFALISNYFSEEKDEFCNNVFQCFVTILRVGLLNTLGSALDVRPSEEYQPNFSLVGGRVIYDLVFFIVVTILGLNLVIVILIDRFSEMRQKKDKVNEDNENRCFICSNEKYKFDEQCGGKAFQKHLDDDHNIWKYIHFILYLQSLHHNDHNALEKYVLQQVKDESIDFFPILRAKVLELKNCGQ